MFARSTFTAALMLFSASFAAAQIGGAGGTIANVDLGDVELPADVIVGPRVCPVATPGQVTANVLAVVQLREQADLALATSTNVGGINVPGATVVGTVGLPLTVCLCVDAGVATNLIDVPDAIKVRADALINAEIAAGAAVNTALTPLNPLLTNPATAVNLVLTPTGQTDCTCPIGYTATCVNGQCGCVLNASGAASANTRRAFGRDSAAIKARQARRSDVVQRRR